MSESMSPGEARSRAAAILEREGIALTEQERGAIEIADFGLADLERTGLEIVAASLTAIVPRNRFPSKPDRHNTRHPPVGVIRKKRCSVPSRRLAHVAAIQRRASRAAWRAARDYYTVFHDRALPNVSARFHP
jgi:hypothetical protein